MNKDLYQMVDSAVVVDVLLTGECSTKTANPGLYSQIIATLGRRPLGIQVSQLKAVIDFISGEYPDQPVRVITKGRVAGLAALVNTALQPQNIDRLELREMDSSLKDFITGNILYDREPHMFIYRFPSLFCFGLLELVDIPELIELAHPVKVELFPAK